MSFFTLGFVVFRFPVNNISIGFKGYWSEFFIIKVCFPIWENFQFPKLKYDYNPCPNKKLSIYL